MIVFLFQLLLMALAEYGILKTKKQKVVIDLIIKQMIDFFSLLNYIIQVLHMELRFILLEATNIFLLQQYALTKKLEYGKLTLKI
jgi:hypothetical protein